MQRVCDLDGDVFAMPPADDLGRTPATGRGPDGFDEASSLPAVGDVIANTRTPDDPTVEYLTEGTPEWADPPFLRVVEVERSDDGWTIRVEPWACGSRVCSPLGVDARVAPPPTGRPLNEEEG